VRPTVLLFDIDGTLVSMKGAGRRALVRAFTEELQRPDVFDDLEFAGMTDPAIIRYGLTRAGIPVDPAVSRVPVRCWPAQRRRLPPAAALSCEESAAWRTARAA